MSSFKAPTLTGSGFISEWHVMSDSSVIPLRLRFLSFFVSVWAAKTQRAYALWITDWLIRTYRSNALRVTHTYVHYEELATSRRGQREAEKLRGRGRDRLYDWKEGKRNDQVSSRLQVRLKGWRNRCRAAYSCLSSSYSEDGTERTDMRKEMG